MKKYFSLFILLAVIFASSEALAYTSRDISAATYLANRGIILKRSDILKYRLDDTITRAEAVGVALKLQGAELPENYTCKNYFTDVAQGTDGWICRAVEMAADAGLITRENTRFRPQDTITRAESLAIMMASGKAQDKLPENWRNDNSIIYDNVNAWQRKLFAQATSLGIVTPITYKVENKNDPRLHTDMKADSMAIRAEVLDFTRNIFKKNNPTTLDTLGVEVDYDKKVTLNDNGDETYTIQLEGERPTSGSSSTGPEVITGLPEPYPIITIREITDESIQEIIKFGFIKPAGVKEFGGIQYFHSITYDMCTGNSYTVFSDQYSYTFAYICGGDFFSEDAKLLNFQSTMQRFSDKDVLKMYYGFLDYPREEWGNTKLFSAYSMRTEIDDSLEKFSAQYKNVTDVTLRENTIKKVDDHTYEFVVDITDNGVKSSYWTKSVVDLNTFTIKQITSEKI